MEGYQRVLWLHERHKQTGDEKPTRMSVEVSVFSEPRKEQALLKSKLLVESRVVPDGPSITGDLLG